MNDWMNNTLFKTVLKLYYCVNWADIKKYIDLPQTWVSVVWGASVIGHKTIGSSGFE